MFELDYPYSVYIALKAIHILSVIGWLVLTSLFIYNNNLCVPCLYNIKYVKIISYAFILSILTGVSLVINYENLSEGWLHLKLLFVFILIFVHFSIIKVYETNCRGDNSGQVPAIDKEIISSTLIWTLLSLFVAIVICVVIRPF